MKPKPFKKKKNGQNKVNKKKLIDLKWVSIVTILAFLISLCFSLVSELTIPNVPIIISMIIVLIVILIGVVFDMIGVAVTIADAKVFHAMAAKRVKGAKIALKMLQNSEKVSSVCNDVVGDVCGIISGSGGAVIAALLVVKLGINALIPSLIITALIASLTIGGKAIGKGIAVNKANLIVEKFSKFLAIFTKKSFKY